MDTQKFPYVTVTNNSNEVIGAGKNIGVMMKAIVLFLIINRLAFLKINQS